MNIRRTLTLENNLYVIQIKTDTDDFPCYETNVHLVVGKKIIAHLFVYDHVIDFLDSLLFAADAAISKKKPYVPCDDIGVAWNNRIYDSTIHNCPPTEHCKKDEFNLSPSPMWSTPHGISSWLYWSGTEIIFEVTKSYPWVFRDPKKNEKYYSYEEFLKNYKPIFKETISQQTAQEWFEKALSWYPDPDLIPEQFKNTLRV